MGCTALQCPQKVKTVAKIAALSHTYNIGMFTSMCIGVYIFYISFYKNSGGGCKTSSDNCFTPIKNITELRAYTHTYILYQNIT